jgi:acyl transferase domain-containing protein/NAD(P)-dependent dehydrogenase (short-subunit alcohol dehydrogenase family)
VSTSSGNDQTKSTAFEEPLAIVGMGAMFPEAEDKDAYWSLIKNGVDAIKEIPDTHWSPDDFYSEDQKKPDFTYGKRGGFISPHAFDPLKYGIPPNVIEATDTSQLLGMVVAERAMEDAGYGMEKKFNRDKTSVILGVTGALELVIPLGARLGHPQWRQAMLDAGLESDVVDDVVERIGDTYVDWQENSFPGLLGNVVAGRISKYLDTGGTNCVVDAACASSLSAVHLAMLELQSGKADMVLTGGTDTFNDIFMYMCFSKTPALSPTGNSRPFDQNGDGTILGEGIGMVVLKRLSDAEKDNDKIYAVIKGIGSSSDGKGDAIYAPSSPGQMKALRTAYESAGVTPETIELLEAHGTGTMKGDAVEIAALNEVYANDANSASWVALGSVKSQIGHTKSAAGSAGMIKAALGLYNKVLPPTIKVDEPAEAVAPGTTPFYVNTTQRPWVPAGDHPRRAAISSFGFGGSNFHIVLEEYAAQKTAPDWDGRVQVFTFSGAKSSDISAELKSISVDTWAQVRAAAAQSRIDFSHKDSYRLALVVEKEKTDLSKIFSRAEELMRKNQSETSWSSPEGIYFSSESVDGKVGIVFPGQGAQYPGMLRDLSCQFPETLDSLALANDVIGGESRLSDRIYPHPAFDKESADAAIDALRATDVAQPAIGTTSLGAYKVLQRFGVEADAFAGHSYGELTALCAGGVLSEEDFMKASRRRGELMGARDGDKGSMAAIRASIDLVQSTIDEHSLDVNIANKNAPEQAVISGASDAVNNAVELFKSKNVPCTPLVVAAAFHSSLVSDAAVPFCETLNNMDFHEAAKPVYSNTTGEAYPTHSDEARELLGNQLARPVDFVGEILAMYADGVRVFVEAGPGKRLSGLIDQILTDKSHTCVAVDASNGKQSGIADLAKALAQLSALGISVDWSEWDADYVIPEAPSGKPRLTVEISGANYRSEHSKKPKRPPLQKKPQPVQQAPATPQTAPSNPAPTINQPIAPPTPSAQQGDTSAISQLLHQTQANIAALQQMQQQTAQLHQQFLQGQAQASQTFQHLMQQQQQLYTHTGTVAPLSSAPVQSPPPVQPGPAQAAPKVETPAPSQELQPETSNVNTTIDALMEVVAEKTGYPVDMLDLSMALDADLGIDSIKRVEILSALQERIPGLPSIEAEELGSIQTLSDIVEQLGDVEVSESGTGAPSVDSNRLNSLLMEVIAEKTGYPVDMLDLDMALDADLGIDSIKRVEILSAMQEAMPKLPTVEAEALGALETLRDVVEHLNENAPSVPVPAAAGVDSNAVQSLLLEVIAEKTGYPEDMLDLDMALDADLGIDSIKRVEILSAMQEAMPELPTVEAEALGALETLRDVIDHLNEQGAPVASSPEPKADQSKVQELLLTVVSEKTGYPVDMLNLDMALDADLGIDSIKRVEILSAMQEAMPELPTVEAEELGNLQTLRDVINQVASNESTLIVQPVSLDVPQPANVPVEEDALTCRVPELISLDADSLKALPTDTIEKWLILNPGPAAEVLSNSLNGRGINNEIVSSIPNTTGYDGVIIIAQDTTAGQELKNDLFETQRAAKVLNEKAGLFATVTFMDGGFGFTEQSVPNPFEGGLAGLAKTAAHEWNSVRCVAFDTDAHMDKSTAADILAELLLKETPAEVGIRADGLVAIREVNAASAEAAGTLPIESNSVVVITGGARGVTAEVAVALAEAAQPTLLLLGRSPLPEKESDATAGISDAAALKKVLLEQMGGKASPKKLEAAYQSLLNAREIHGNLDRMTAAGATVQYESVDIRSKADVAKMLADAAAKLGPITDVIHGAGVLADRLIVDKTADQFDAVFGTKVDGLDAVLSAIDTSRLQSLVMFSSSTGRYGRKGQVDYAMANEVLNKTAQVFAKEYPQCKVVSVNWGPWAGGMVTPELRNVFAAEGIGLVGLRSGSEWLLNELAQAPSGPVEFVVLGELAGTEKEDSPQSRSSDLKPVLSLDVSVKDYPFLKSHVMGGKAVLPAAMYMEWFAHAAMHANPGLHFIGVDDLRITKGVLLEADETIHLSIIAGTLNTHPQGHVVDLELRSGPELKVLHGRVQVILGVKYEQPAPNLLDQKLGDYPRLMDEVYDNGLLFHGELLQGIETVNGYSPEGIDVTVHPAPVPTHWMKEPPRRKWLSDPLVMDCAFQALILWSFESHKAGSLPVHVKSYRQMQSAWPKGKVDIKVNIEKSNEHQAVSTIEFIHADDGKLLAVMEGYECVIDASLNESFQRTELAQPSL